MNEMRPLVGIDLGSSSVSVVVGEMEEERLVVRGCGQARHDGARKGIIANLDEVSQAVRVAAEEAEAMASLPVEFAQVGIGGTPIHGVPSTASVPVTGRDRTVTSEDLQRALAACAQVSIPEDYRVLDITGRDVTERKAALAPGVYFLRPDDEGSSVHRVVIAR